MDLSGLNGFLLIAHQQIALLTNAPELEINEREAGELSRAVGNVARHYAPEVSQKWIDWTALISCAGSIYGTRLYLIADRKRSERSAANTNEAGIGIVNVPGVYPGMQ